MKKSLKGKENPKSLKIKGKSILTGNEIQFDSISDVVNFGFNKSNVIGCLKGRNRTHKKHIWEYV